MDQNQPPEQARFRAKYNKVDHLHTNNPIIEKTQEYRHKIYVAFIDYRKASDSVEHTKILDSMEAIAVHPKYIILIREMYKNSNAKVPTEIQGEMFRTKRGVRGGDPISPKLFTCLLETIFRKLNWNRKRVGVKNNGRWLSNLRFADDIVIFAKSTTELQSMMTGLNTRSKEMGLLMNPTKTKINSNPTETPIIIDDTPIENCKEYNYLGQITRLTRNRDKSLQRRISLAWGKFWSPKLILLDKSINTNLRLEAIQTLRHTSSHMRQPNMDLHKTTDAGDSDTST
jgi:hypothetical protein